MEEVTVAVRGISLNVLVDGPVDGTPVLLVHGNCSSAAFWRPLLRHLPPHLRIVAPDLRGYGQSESAPVDATRGLSDFADDVAALLDNSEIWRQDGRKITLVAHSMGCGVAMQLLVDHPTRFGALLLEAPLSPYGFGGTHGLEGTPLKDFAGTGGGAANPDFVRRISAGDRSGDSPTSPLTVLRTAYVADPASLGEDEQLLLDTVLSTAIGDDNYPGDSKPTDTWPGIAPGDRGVLNTMAPNHFNIAAALVAVDPKPPITWVRGDKDAIVSDTSFFDLAYLGQIGAVPGWPGEDVCPPQPMVSQTRAVFERYGPYTEVVYANCGHSPHVERPTEVAAELLKLV